MSNTLQLVRFKFSESKDRAALVEFVANTMKLDIAKLRKDNDIKAGVVSYDSITKMLRNLKCSFSYDADTEMFSCYVPLVEFEVTDSNAIKTPEFLEPTPLDEVDPPVVSKLGELPPELLDQSEDEDLF